MDSLTSNRPDTREALQKRYGAEAIPAVGPWNDTIALLLNHRSVRGYKPDPVPAGTLEMLARFSVLSRLREHANSNVFSKMRVYDGESLREVDPRARSMQEYKDTAGVDEGMDGI